MLFCMYIYGGLSMGFWGDGRDGNRLNTYSCPRHNARMGIGIGGACSYANYTPAHMTARRISMGENRDWDPRPKQTFSMVLITLHTPTHPHTSTHKGHLSRLPTIRTRAANNSPIVIRIWLMHMQALHLQTSSWAFCRKRNEILPSARCRHAWTG